MTEGGLPLLVIPDLHLHAEVVIIIPLPPNEGITLDLFHLVIEGTVGRGRTQGIVERGHTLIPQPTMVQGAEARVQLGRKAQVEAVAKVEVPVEAQLLKIAQRDLTGMAHLVREILELDGLTACEIVIVLLTPFWNELLSF